MAELTVEPGMVVEVDLPGHTVEAHTPNWQFELAQPAWNFEVATPTTATTTTATAATDVDVLLVPGPQGPPGTGDQDWHLGAGPPPDVIVGANPGDMYLDTVNGHIYRLT